MQWLYSFILLTQQFLPGSFTVELQTESYPTVLSGKTEKYKRLLGSQIDRGWVDSLNLTVAAKKSEISEQLIKDSECDDQDRCTVPLSSYTYKISTESIRKRMQEKIFPEMGAMNAYKVKATLCFKFDFPAYVDSCKSIPIEHLSDSEFLNRWAYQKSETEGPNCFHSSLATAGESWLAPQFISENYFKHYLKNGFTEVSEPKFADIVVLSNGESIEHAASFVIKNKDGETIVFTKNGKVEGYYLFMNLHDLMMDPFAYPNTTAKFYSPIKTNSKENI